MSVTQNLVAGPNIPDYADRDENIERSKQPLSLKKSLNVAHGNPATHFRPVLAAYQGPPAVAVEYSIRSALQNGSAVTQGFDSVTAPQYPERTDLVLVDLRCVPSVPCTNVARVPERNPGNVHDVRKLLRAYATECRTQRRRLVDGQ